MVLVVLPLSPRDAVNYGSFHFLFCFQNAEPNPVSYPDSRVESGAERHKVDYGKIPPFGVKLGGGFYQFWRVAEDAFSKIGPMALLQSFAVLRTRS
jgi:hypothetical protein